jgi:hypothetical protein
LFGLIPSQQVKISTTRKAEQAKKARKTAKKAHFFVLFHDIKINNIACFSFLFSCAFIAQEQAISDRFYISV